MPVVVHWIGLNILDYIIHQHPFWEIAMKVMKELTNIDFYH